jgi:uncharacterized membrane protein YfhO
MLWYGAPNGHNIDHNLVWMTNFTSQVAQGDLYPRWLMDMNRGVGSPVFYFYGPLPFHIISPFSLLLSNSPLTQQLAWGEWCLIALSGLAFFFYARRHSRTGVALVCGCLYMVLPYHFEINLWQRQDLGEIAIYIWMPLILHYTEKLFDSKRGQVGLAVTYALLLLSHLPGALLFSICLGTYVLTQISSRESFKALLQVACAAAIGILLAGIYIVPALFSQDYIYSEIWQLFNFGEWLFPDWKQLMVNPEARAFGERLFLVLGIETVAFAVCLISLLRRRDAIGVRPLVGLLVMVVLCWFLMSSWSRFVWEHAPLLAKVQFPWRIAIVIDFATALAVLYAAHSLYVLRDRYSAAALAISFTLLIGTLATSDVIGKLDPFYDATRIAVRDEYVRIGGEAPEYTTAWNPVNPVKFLRFEVEAPEQSQVTFDPAKGNVAVKRWSPRRIELTVTLAEPDSILVRQFYYPNWRATIDGRKKQAVEPSKQWGLLKLSLPAGHYGLALTLEPLPQERIGAAATLLGVLLLLLWTQRPRVAPLLTWSRHA